MQRGEGLPLRRALGSDVGRRVVKTAKEGGPGYLQAKVWMLGKSWTESSRDHCDRGGRVAPVKSVESAATRLLI